MGDGKSPISNEKSGYEMMHISLRTLIIAIGVVVLTIYLVIPIIGLPEHSAVNSSSTRHQARRPARSTSGFRASGISARSVGFNNNNITTCIGETW